MTNNRDTVIRSLHDLGGAAWFGGSLMGAVGLNGASQDVSNPAERTRVASTGWARWSPVAATAIASHLAGGLGLVLANRGRVKHQAGVGTNTVVKSLLTGAALASTAYSGMLGSKLLAAGKVQSDGGTVPTPATPDDVAKNQQRLRSLQWITPALTGLIVVLGAQQGEQQKPRELASGLARGVGRFALRS